MIFESDRLQAELLSESDLLQRAARLKGVEISEYGDAALGTYILTDVIVELQSQGVYFYPGRGTPVTAGRNVIVPYRRSLPSRLELRAGFRMNYHVDKHLEEELFEGVVCVPLTPFGTTLSVWRTSEELFMPVRAEVLILQALAGIDPCAHPLLKDLARREGYLRITWKELGCEDILPLDELFDRTFCNKFVSRLARSHRSPFRPSPTRDVRYVPGWMRERLQEEWHRQLNAYKNVKLLPARSS